MNCILKEALAVGLELELSRFGQDGSYFKELPAMLLKKRDTMAQVLQEVGLTPVIPEGGYFMMADTAALGALLYTCHLMFYTVARFQGK